MKPSRTLPAILVLLLAAWPAAAQEHGISARLYGTVGHNYANSFYLALAATGQWQSNETLRLTAGVEAFRSRGYAATASWQAQLPWPSKRFFVYNRYLYRLFARWNTNEYSAHTALGYESGHWRVTLGLANRFMSPFHPYDRTGSTEYVFEPFNLMYEVQYRFALDAGKRWEVVLRMADFDDFVTDRAYQPLFSAAAGHRFGHGLTAYARAVCYPTGMLSLSANYYELFLNLGIQKQW